MGDSFPHRSIKQLRLWDLSSFGMTNTGGEAVDHVSLNAGDMF